MTMWMLTAIATSAMSMKTITSSLPCMLPGGRCTIAGRRTLDAGRPTPREARAVGAMPLDPSCCQCCHLCRNTTNTTSTTCFPHGFCNRCCSCIVQPCDCYHHHYHRYHCQRYHHGVLLRPVSHFAVMIPIMLQPAAILACMESHL